MSNDLFSVSKRVALVTGASSGIGSYIAKGLADAGMSRVYISGRREDALQTVASTAPHIIIPIIGDVGTRKGASKWWNSLFRKRRKPA